QPVARVYEMGSDVRALQRRVVEVVEIVEHHDPVAPRQAPVRQVRADEARPSRDEDLHEAGFDSADGTGVGEGVVWSSWYSFLMAAFCRSLMIHFKSADSSTPTTSRLAAS